jgi:hypothetical protein
METDIDEGHVREWPSGVQATIWARLLDVYQRLETVGG